jgi:hypothetical protein
MALLPTSPLPSPDYAPQGEGGTCPSGLENLNFPEEEGFPPSPKGSMFWKLEHSILHWNW